MALLTVAKVAVENTTIAFDKLFDYSVPSDLLSDILPGMRVAVPFGNSSKKRTGIVFSIDVSKNSGKRLKKVSAILDKEPLLNSEMLSTACFIRERTFCTYFDACKLFLPLSLSLNIKNTYFVDNQYNEALNDNEKIICNYLLKKGDFVPEDEILKSCNLSDNKKILNDMYQKGILLRDFDAHRRVGDASVKMVKLSDAYLNEELSVDKITKKQKEIINILSDVGSASVKELNYFSGFSSAVIGALKNKGIVDTYDEEIYRKPYIVNEHSDNITITLSDEQKKVYDGLLKLYSSNEPKCALLYGVTGSGKTQVYLKLIDDVLKSGDGIIVMIPEISLTPQLLNLFFSKFGDKVAVFHSALSLGQRLDEWKRIKRGDAKIAIGTRSAVFAPFDKIGLIIIDEEQEHTYKSEMNPRYDAREVASYRIGQDRGLLLLSSATPSMTSYTKAVNNKFSLFELKERYGNAVLPEVEIIDTTYESDMVIDNISSKLATEIKHNYSAGKQTILLLNRRGYNTFAKCTECGSVLTCPNCSISLTYHLKNNRLMCHYCGYSVPFSSVCPSCSNDSVKFLGTGTQKLEDELKIIVPEAKILRMDADTASSRYSYETKFKSFADGKYDILLGTQMIAKGLNFPNVTLVGVLSVDLMLFNDDYKSGERAFDLITQVVGRCGRGNYKGKAYIQTAFPESEIINLAKDQDYNSFYNLEMDIRKQMVYPPYCDICIVGFSSEKEIYGELSAVSFLNIFKELHKQNYSDVKVIVLGPVAPRISKISGKYRNRIIIKCRNNKNFRNLIRESLIEFQKTNKYKDVSIFADINPENTM